MTDRFAAPGEAMEDKYYDSFQVSLQEDIQKRIDELVQRRCNWHKRLDDIIVMCDEDAQLWENIEAYQESLLEEQNEIQNYYDDDDFEAMDSYLFGLKQERKKWKSK